MSGRGVKTAFQGRAKQILIRIADNSGEMHTNQLVEMLGMKRPNVAKYVSLLREEGFITSAKSGNDKRFVYHSLTVKGRQYLDGLGGSSSEPVKDLTSPAEREAEIVIRSQAQNENLDKLLNDSEDLLSEKEKKFDFNNDGEMSF